MNHISLKKEKMNDMYKNDLNTCLHGVKIMSSILIQTIFLAHTEVLPVVEFNLEEGIR